MQVQNYVHRWIHASVIVRKYPQTVHTIVQALRLRKQLCACSSDWARRTEPTEPTELIEYVSVTPLQTLFPWHFQPRNMETSPSVEKPRGKDHVRSHRSNGIHHFVSNCDVSSVFFPPPPLFASCILYLNEMETKQPPLFA